MSSMDAFMKRFGGRDEPKSKGFSSYEDPAEEHKSDLEAFVRQFGNVTEEYEFHFREPGGKIETVKLRFDKDEHVYYRLQVNDETGEVDWIKVPGITTIIGIKDKSQVLMPWAANEAVSYVKAAFLELEPYELNVLQSDPLKMQAWLFDTLDEAKKNYKNLSKQATDIGKAAHDWLENYVKSIIANNKDEQIELMGKLANMDERAISCCEAALDWMRAHNVRWLYTERKVYSRDFDAAGTLDGVCTVDSCNDPECCPKPFKDVTSIIDWKSSNALYDSYRWQVAAYKYMVFEELGIYAEHCWVIQLGKYDGAFKRWHILDEDFEMDLACFRSCLNLTKTTETATETLRKRRADAKAAKKAAREAAEAAEKAERLRIRTARKQARIDRKNVYKMHRANGHSVAIANKCADAWLKRELAKIGGADEEETEDIPQEAAA